MIKFDNINIGHKIIKFTLSQVLYIVIENKNNVVGNTSTSQMLELTKSCFLPLWLKVRRWHACKAHDLSNKLKVTTFMPQKKHI